MAAVMDALDLFMEHNSLVHFDNAIIEHFRCFHSLKQGGRNDGIKFLDTTTDLEVIDDNFYT